MSGFLDFLSNLLSITGDSTIDSILFTIIGIAAFVVAWYATAILADFVGFDSGFMKIIHWTIRIVTWVLLFFVLDKIVSFVIWFFSFEWWVYIIIGVSLALIAGGVIALRIVLKKKKKDKDKTEDQD